MKSWLIGNQLVEIFDVKVQDRERLEFWKQYVRDIRKIVYLESLNQAIIMETERDTFVEFGKTGNALYIYNGRKLKEFKENTNIYRLKNKDRAYDAFNHRGYWQQKLERELWVLGYQTRKKKGKK